MIAPAPDDLDVLSYLADKGYRGKPAAGGREITFPCFFDCQEDPSSRRRKLYVNRADGWYHCKVCEASGGTFKLLQHFGDDPKRASEDHVASATRRDLLTRAAEVGAHWLTENDALITYLLEDRGLSPETIVDRRLGCVVNPWSLVGHVQGANAESLQGTGLVYAADHPTRAGQDFFYNHLLIPYVSRGSVVQLRGRALADSGGRYITGPGDSISLYNVDALEEATDVIVCEGEFDAMVLDQHLSASGDPRAQRIGVVALPGVNSLPEDFERSLADARRIFIGFDSDDAGSKAAEKIKEKLGSRVRVLTWPDDLLTNATRHGLKKVDWTDAFVKLGLTWQRVLMMMGAASGKRLKSVADAGSAFRRGRADVDGLRLGFAPLDATITPGLLPGQVMIPLAKTGTGKSIWLCNVAYNTRRTPTLFITLEMTAEEMYERLLRIYRFYKPGASPQEAEFAYRNLALVDENKLENGDMTSLIEEYELEYGSKPRLVVVDYLGYYARGFRGGSPYEKTSDAVMELKAQAKSHRVSIIAPHQVNRMGKEGKPLQSDDARDSGVVEETADFMLGLWKPDDALTVDGRPTGNIKMTLLKSRHGGKDRTFTVAMGLLSLVMADHGGPHTKTIADENYLAWRGMDYDAYRTQLTA